MKTDLTKVLAISGQSGLYLYVAHTRSGAVVEAFADKKRSAVSASSKITSLADISIYTDDEEVKLQQVFLNMKEVLGDAIRYVIAHEIGHCLGFMHNMSASSVIPVEMLRDPEFTQTHGTTTSIMDYARFNYVAQPDDKERGVKLTPPRFGSYDKWLIEWTYKPVFDADTFAE